MTATKVVLIVLVVIVVLFVVLVVSGSRRSASGPKTDENTFDPKQHSTLDAFNGVLAPFGPKLDLTKKTFDLSSTSSAVPVQVTIPKDESHKFRNAKFRITPGGCAQMKYQAPDGDGDRLNSQPYPKQGTKYDPTQASFTILQSGGTLTLIHNTPPPQHCVVELE
jgi:hypothetical protein